MQYLGAAHYYFWEGVEAALSNPRLNVDGRLENMFTIKSQVTEDCCEAFSWGFSLGQALTKTEFKNLTTIPKPVIIEKSEPEPMPKEKAVAVIDELDQEYPVEGNC